MFFSMDGILGTGLNLLATAQVDATFSDVGQISMVERSQVRYHRTGFQHLFEPYFIIRSTKQNVFSNGTIDNPRVLY